MNYVLVEKLKKYIDLLDSLKKEKATKADFEAKKRAEKVKTQNEFLGEYALDINDYLREKCPIPTEPQKVKSYAIPLVLLIPFTIFNFIFWFNATFNTEFSNYMEQHFAPGVRIPTLLALLILVFSLIVLPILTIRLIYKQAKTSKERSVYYKKLAQYNSDVDAYPQLYTQWYYHYIQNRQYLLQQYPSYFQSESQRVKQYIEIYDGHIRYHDSIIANLNYQMAPLAYEISLPSDYLEDSYKLSRIQRVLEAGRADSTKEALQQLQLEDYQKEMARMQYQQAEEQRRYEQERNELIRKANEDRERYYESQQRHLESMQRQNEEAARQQQKDAERRGQKQCQSCKNFLSCGHRYSNTGNCGGFSPSRTSW